MYIETRFAQYISIIFSFIIKRRKNTWNTWNKYFREFTFVDIELQKAGFQIDIAKCEFFVQNVKYLNLIITPESIKMDQKKLSAVFDWSIFGNLKNIQSFLGFANFQKHFIRDFSKLTAPLNALAIFFSLGFWTTIFFDNFKIAFTTVLIILYYDPDEQTMVKTEVSDYVTAGILFQNDDNGQLKPVVYFFCKMNPAECNYEIYEKKTAGKHWRTSPGNHWS